MDAIIDAHMDWSLSVGDAGFAGEYSHPPGAIIQNTYNVRVVDIFSNVFSP